MMNGTGATSWSKLQETLEKMTIEKIGYLPTMKGLKDNFKKNLTVVTYNLTKDETVYIDAESHPELPALVALRMTANLPFVFEKFQYRGNYFIDGGAGNNFPLSQAEKKGKRVLGLRVNNAKTLNPFKTYRLGGGLTCLSVSISREGYVAWALADLDQRTRFLEEDGENVNILDIKRGHIEEMIYKGITSQVKGVSLGDVIDNYQGLIKKACFHMSKYVKENVDELDKQLDTK